MFVFSLGLRPITITDQSQRIISPNEFREEVEHLRGLSESMVLTDNNLSIIRLYRSLIRKGLRSDTTSSLLNEALLPSPSAKRLNYESTKKALAALSRMLDGGKKVDIEDAQQYIYQHCPYPSLATTTTAQERLAFQSGYPLFTAMKRPELFDKRRVYVSLIMPEKLELDDTLLDNIESLFFFKRWMSLYSLSKNGEPLLNQKMRSEFMQKEGGERLFRTYFYQLIQAWILSNDEEVPDPASDPYILLRHIQSLFILVDRIRQRYTFFSSHAARYSNLSFPEIPPISFNDPHFESVLEDLKKYFHDFCDGDKNKKLFLQRSGALEVIALMEKLMTLANLFKHLVENKPQISLDLVRRLYTSGQSFSEKVASLVLGHKDPVLTNYHEIPLQTAEFESHKVQYQYSGINIMILNAILKFVPFAPADVVYDIGSGYGRLAAYLGCHLSVPIRGIEIVPQRHEEALQLREHLQLTHVEFLCGDALDINLSDGTTFILFNPLSPEQLDQFLLKIKTLTRSTGKKIRIISYGPSNYALSTEGDWLSLKRIIQTPESDRDDPTRDVFVFESRLSI